MPLPNATISARITQIAGVIGSAWLIKGIFLLRKSSEGLGLSDQELARLSDPSNRKGFPSIIQQASQVVQDFGTGSFLLWPILNLGRDIDKSWSDPPMFRVFLVGVILFFLGWVVRRLLLPTNAVNSR
jgi:hypothetical protein